ncbi:MAG: sigma 54-interacting transcriptional regulator [Clostridiales bacterium]|nr:sigma 54-interacting transcriptional regulator [Clostridiales bacterium]
MDYSIALILPSRLVCETAKATMKTLQLDYPVYAASRHDALEVARSLIPRGVRIIISHGLTYKYLKEHISIPLMELPFSSLDAAVAIRDALKHSDKIAHVGSDRLYRYLLRSLKFLGVDTNLGFCDLVTERTVEEQAQEMLDQGYEVLIGGFPSTDLANRLGFTGIEFNVDELVIEATLLNAQTLVREMIRQEKSNELDRVILQSVSDGIVAVGEDRRIFKVNPAAASLLKRPEEAIMGRDFEELLKECNIVNIDSVDEIHKIPASHTTVILNELPVVVREKREGSVISILKISDVQAMQYKIHKDLILRGLVAKYTFDDIGGKSPAITMAKEKARSYAGYDSTLLIYGESGTGKELMAQSVHNASRRCNHPFVAINCASFPANLIESELFGYVSGAFTGARKEGRAGLFEMADQGTIFLDEIAEIPLELQPKLLRVIQEGEIIRIGGNKVIHIDTRVICATNKDLFQLVQEGKFREDLYYRVCVLEIKLPPLRERREDIPVLCENLLQNFSLRHNKHYSGFTSEAMSCIRALPLPGNIRELSNIIERMVILAREDEEVLTERTLAEALHTSISDTNPAPLNERFEDVSSIPRVPELCVPLNEQRRKATLWALEQCHGNQTEAAKLLGIHPSTLWRRLRSYQTKTENVKG